MVPKHVGVLIIIAKHILLSAFFWWVCWKCCCVEVMKAWGYNLYLPKVFSAWRFVISTTSNLRRPLI